MYDTANGRIGLHIRITQAGLIPVIKKALAYKLPWFQCFLVDHKGEYQIFSDQEKEWIQEQMHQFKYTFVHSSYWINFCNPSQRTKNRALYEMKTAVELGFTHFVVHVGASLRNSTKEEGIKVFAEMINELLLQVPTLTFVLENVAHAGRAMGGSLEELSALKNLITQGKSGICIDTSHAYVYGYNLKNFADQDNFFKQIEIYLGKDAISLVHLNDTLKTCGSKIDHHAVPGTGQIGDISLAVFMRQPMLLQIPIILELPELEMAEEERVIQHVQSLEMKLKI